MGNPLREMSVSLVVMGEREAASTIVSSVGEPVKLRAWMVPETTAHTLNFNGW